MEIKGDYCDVLNARHTKPWDGGASFSLRHRMHRALWSATWLLLASWTPPMTYRWRRFLLVLFGAKMAPLSDVRGSARVWYPPNLTMGDRSIIADGVYCYNMGPVQIGERSIVSQRAFLCGGTHDISDPDRQLITRPIIIESYCWVAAEAFVGPGVTMRRGSILGARGVAFSDLKPWTVYAGNPARAIRTRPSLECQR